MRRTQISLTAAERELLDALSARPGRSLSALIRDTIEIAYGAKRSTDDARGDPSGQGLLDGTRHRLGRLGRHLAHRLPAGRTVTAVVDTSVLIDCFRGHQGAAELLESERAPASLHASELTRLEILAWMRPSEATATETELLLSTLIWHPLDANVARRAGALRMTSVHSSDPGRCARGRFRLRAGSRPACPR